MENKKLTHDIFVESGYEHLMPKQLCFRRVYQERVIFCLGAFGAVGFLFGIGKGRLKRNKGLRSYLALAHTTRHRLYTERQRYACMQDIFEAFSPLHELLAAWHSFD